MKLFISILLTTFIIAGSFSIGMSGQANSFDSNSSSTSIHVSNTGVNSSSIVIDLGSNRSFDLKEFAEWQFGWLIKFHKQLAGNLSAGSATLVESCERGSSEVSWSDLDYNTLFSPDDTVKIVYNSCHTATLGVLDGEVNITAMTIVDNPVSETEPGETSASFNFIFFKTSHDSEVTADRETITVNGAVTLTLSMIDDENIKLKISSASLTLSSTSGATSNLMLF